MGVSGISRLWSGRPRCPRARTLALSGDDAEAPVNYRKLKQRFLKTRRGDAGGRLDGDAARAVCPYPGYGRASGRAARDPG